MKRPLMTPRPRVKLDVSIAIVNIVLLLIFFFLATGRLLNPIGPDLELSETSELPLEDLPSPILVIKADATWELDGVPVAPEFLGLAIGDLPQPVTLHLLINRTAPANALLSVLNRPELEDIEVRLVTLHLREG